MSVVPHTAGPLKALKGSEFETDRWTVVTEGERAYLIATIENGQPGDTLDTEAATAHLFAGAPELLAALRKAKEVIKAWHGEGGWEFYDLHSPEMQPINAAIAKAEGRAGV